MRCRAAVHASQGEVAGGQVTKLCIDCKHLQPDGSYTDPGARDRYGLCTAVENFHPVDGQKYYVMAQQVRMQHAECGPEARLFVAKES